MIGLPATEVPNGYGAHWRCHLMLAEKTPKFIKLSFDAPRQVHIADIDDWQL